MIVRNTFRVLGTLVAVLFLITTTRDALGLGCPHHDLMTTVDQEHHCTCIGSCNGTPTTPPPSGPLTVVANIEGVIGEPDLEPECYLQAPIPFLLHRANAPPISL